MKPLQLSEDIVPIGELKAQASRVLRQLQASQRPVVITQNGKPAAVLITPEEFDRIRERDRFVFAVQEGLADAEAGRLVDDDDLESYFDEKFGPLQPG